MDLGMAGKTAVVTAAGGGLGGAIAAGLAREGVAVAVADIDRAAAWATTTQITEAGGIARDYTCDLSDSASVTDLAEKVHRELGEPEVLVNITGGPPPSSISGVNQEIWAAQFQAMVAGVILLTDLLLPAMRERKWGRIITSTSSGVVSPIPNLGISNTLRAALAGWSKTLASEVGADGVTVNVAVPGRIATRRIEQLDRARAEREGKTPQQVAGESSASIPIHRYGLPEEYAAPVVFLASQQASYITGAMLRIDGGLIPSV